MGDKGLRIGLSALRIAIIVAGAALTWIILSNSVSEETWQEGDQSYGKYLDQLFYIIYAVGAAAGIAAILFGLAFFLLNFREKIGTLIGVIGFAIVGLISYYQLSDSTVLKAYEASGIVVTEGESWFAGGGLWFVYLLGLISIGAIVWAEVSRIFK
jgi:hypothetical protein